ncbi:MAG: hypothetical protein R3A45_00385 [Bdellovibrionota bacterium]
MQASTKKIQYQEVLRLVGKVLKPDLNYYIIAVIYGGVVSVLDIGHSNISPIIGQYYCVWSIAATASGVKFCFVCVVGVVRGF